MVNKFQEFKNIQKILTAHIKNPAINPAPKDIEDRRIEIYRDLFYRNIQGFIAKAFPVLRKLYSNEDWHKMVRDFFSEHQSKSPYFKDISYEFLKYLQNERKPRPEDPVFLVELAHYEWIEIHLTFLDIEPDFSHINKTGDLLKGIPILSPLAQMYNYQYPVHKIGPSFQPKITSETPIHLMVYRNYLNEVGFIELNSISAMLVRSIENNTKRSGQELLENIVDELNHPNPGNVFKGGKFAFEALHKNNILLGTKSIV